jgi:hypothetical protein
MGEFTTFTNGKKCWRLCPQIPPARRGSELSSYRFELLGRLQPTTTIHASQEIFRHGFQLNALLGTLLTT